MSQSTWCFCRPCFKNSFHDVNNSLMWMCAGPVLYERKENEIILTKGSANVICPPECETHASNLMGAGISSFGS